MCRFVVDCVECVDDKKEMCKIRLKYVTCVDFISIMKNDSVDNQ